MSKQIILSMCLITGLFLVNSIDCIAQSKTKEELQAEREELKTEMKSKEAQKRKAKLEKLEAPNPTGMSSVDNLASSSTEMLAASKDFNVLVPEMYKRTIGETIDGVTDVTVKKPTLKEVTDLAENITKQIKVVSEASEAVSSASSEVKSASPMEGLKATKSLNYSKDVISLVGQELQLNLKVVSNLIATLKSGNNY